MINLSKCQSMCCETWEVKIKTTVAACPQKEAPPSLRDVACLCMDLLLSCAEGASHGDLPQVGGCAVTASQNRSLCDKLESDQTFF